MNKYNSIAVIIDTIEAIKSVRLRLRAAALAHDYELCDKLLLDLDALEQILIGEKERYTRAA